MPAPDCPAPSPAANTTLVDRRRGSAPVRKLGGGGSLGGLWRELASVHRRWLVQNALLVTALINLLVNAGIAWLSLMGEHRVPLWSIPLVEKPSTITDTIGTFFLLPLITCLLCTTTVWHDLAAGRLPALGRGSIARALVARLPTTRLRRGLLFGALCTAALAPLSVLVLLVTDFAALSPGQFVIYKAALAVVLGAVVTPVIAVSAMADGHAQDEPGLEIDPETTAPRSSPQRRLREIRVSEMRLLGSGREAEVFAWDRDRVLRLARKASHAEHVRREAFALAAAHRAGAPVPAPYEQVMVEGRPGVVVDRVGDEDLLTVLGRRPWLVWSVGRTCGALHARLHDVTAPAELPALHDLLRWRLSSDLVPDDVRSAALAALDHLPAGNSLLHGDFHPANVFDGPDGQVVIDWTLGARGDPAGDVARTRLLLLRSAVPADAPAVLRRLARLGRQFLWRPYLHGYQQLRSVDRTLVDRWEPVWAAARLAEGIAAERKTLLAAARSQ
jgi:aminoglycoside phosphotransferase (APT) family kinase protein